MVFEKRWIPEGATGSAILKKVDSAIDALETISLNCVIDSAGAVVSANEGFARLAGTTPEAIVHQSILPVLRRVGQLRLAVEALRVLRRNEQFRREVEVVLEADHRWFDVHAIPRHNDAAALSGAVIVLMDITERKLVHEALAYHAFHDALTGLPNRRLLMDRMMQARYRSDRFHEMFAIFYMDLDFFKHVNDTFGHRAGDAVLVETANRLRSLLRRDDTVCRQGGDEFILLLPGIHDEESLAVLAQKIIARIAEPFPFDGQSLRVGASIGVSVYPTDGEDRERLIQMADKALYRAKQAGRNRFMICGRTAFQRPTADVAAEAARLSPSFQPIFNAGDMSLLGFEVRFASTGRGDGVGPGARITEELLVHLYDEAFKAYRAWTRGRDLPLKLVFHVPGKELAHPSVLAALHASAARAGVSLEQIAVSVRQIGPQAPYGGVPVVTPERATGPEGTKPGPPQGDGPPLP